HDVSETTHSAIAQAQYFRLLIMKIVYAIQLIPVCYFGSKRIVAFNKRVKNFYANTEEKTLDPIRLLLIIFIIFTILSAIANYIGRDFFIQESWMA
ncbi:hypothetical protein, partial [Bacteroides heparinolyticus]|uniref:hypothetical protein n=1 Tax=Prevotella heparinolytica TaxID=28113 RepID=UPI0035A11D86